jgi:hypothetical protein
MGISFVLFFWSVIGVLLAIVATNILRAAATFLTRKATKDRRKVILAVGLFPWLCLGWGGAVFLFQAEVNETVFHRDPEIGDAWECPLPNGYALLMIDVPDQGFVYNPKTQPAGSIVGEQEDAVAGVRVLQLAGRYIVGGTDSSVGQMGKGQVDSYFLLDTMTGRHTRFSLLDDLRSASLPLGIQLNLEAIGRVYSRYRYTWFDVLAEALFCGPPLLAMAFLGLWIMKLRRTGDAIAQAV